MKVTCLLNKRVEKALTYLMCVKIELAANYLFEQPFGDDEE